MLISSNTRSSLILMTCTRLNWNSDDSDGDHQWFWSQRSDDSSCWVSRTWGRGLQEQSNLLHLGKLFVVVVEEVLSRSCRRSSARWGKDVGKRSTFNQHPLSPDSAGWASKWGETAHGGDLNSWMFCNAGWGPSLPHPFPILWSAGCKYTKEET